MKRISYILGVAGVSGLVVYMAHASDQVAAAATPMFGIGIPPGYRDWQLISVAHEAGNNNDLRAVLGNDIAIKAYRAHEPSFPDGAIIARLAWTYVPSDENNKVFGREQSFVAGPPVNVQFMVKDSKRYAATAGWGFAQFKEGVPVADAALAPCFACHVPVKSRDYVFTQYSPSP
jgi:Cytochrome P460